MEFLSKLLISAVIYLSVSLNEIVNVKVNLQVTTDVEVISLLLGLGQLNSTLSSIVCQGT